MIPVRRDRHYHGHRPLWLRVLAAILRMTL